MGPEVGMEKLEEQVRGIEWDGTGVGYGVRGSRLQDLTIRLEGEICRARFHTSTTLLTPCPQILLLFIARKPQTRGSCSTTRRTRRCGRLTGSSRCPATAQTAQARIWYVDRRPVPNCADILQGFEVICDICEE